MMPAIDLSKVVGGFDDPVHDSQRIFRDALQALSHPGEIVALIPQAAIPDQAQPSAAVLLLALLDADSRLWLSPTLAASDAAHWIVFHTNCTLVDQPALADFAWVQDIDEMPALSRFNQGTDEYPELSTTCLLNVSGLENESNLEPVLTLQGPGILGTNQLCVNGMKRSDTEILLSQWQSNHQQFPKGVDIFLCGVTQIAGLPRTTKLSLTETSVSLKG
jgi:alpha-D-ribose 1-methylphosphonate 5-triphosphate synthase subunit PhnH